MNDQTAASRLAREGFDLWQSGQPEEAAVKYQQALKLVDSDHYAVADYHQELAAILAELGRDVEALDQYRQAIAVYTRRDPEESSLDVSIARYFQSELLLKMNRPDEALEAIEPVLHSKLPWLAHVVRSDAFWKPERRNEATAEAALALSRADSEEKRTNVRDRLAHILVAE
jgi:tetratricopeptide (TPR) repeat protein